MDRRLTTSRLSRRTVFKGAAAGAAAGTLFTPTLFNVGGRAAAQETAEVRLAYAPSSPAETEFLEQVIGEFQTANPNITVNLEAITAEYLTALQTALAAGTAADVFYVDSLPAQDLMSRDVLLPMDDFLTSSDISTDDFYPGLIEAFQWEGATYGLPKDFSPLAMLTNTQMFADAGIENPPTTWDELRSAAETLTEQLGQPAIVYGPSLDRFIAFLFQAGGGVLNPEATEFTIDSDATTQALEFYYGLYADGLAATPVDVGAGWAGDAIAQGLAAIVFEGNWFFPFKQESAPDLDVGIYEMPAGPAGKGSPAFTVAYCISAATEVPDAAWQVVNYLASSEGMWEWTSLGLAMPSRPDLAERWIAEFPEREPYIAAGDYARGWDLGPGGDPFNSDANAILENLFAGGVSVEEARAELVAAAQEEIELAEST